MAYGRGETDQVLARDPAGGHQLRAPGRGGETTLADRARLPGTQAGTRARPLRGPRLARLPSPRHVVHRGLWLPDRRAGEDSPLGIASRRDVQSASPTQKLPTPRRRRSGPSDTCRTRLPPCDDGSRWRSREVSNDVRAAPCATKSRPTIIVVCDTVELAAPLT